MAGPEELAQVVESLSDLRIDHAVVIDFQHLADMTTAMGGVDVVQPEAVTDPRNGFTWEKGPLHLEGDMAVAYVRQRYGMPRGDFDRIQRQQNVLRAMLDKVASAGTLSNPVRITNLVTQLASFVAVDAGFTPSEMRSLAISSRGIRPANMRFVTVPVTGTPTIDGASVVTLDLDETGTSSTRSRRTGSRTGTRRTPRASTSCHPPVRCASPSALSGRSTPPGPHWPLRCPRPRMRMRGHGAGPEGALVVRRAVNRLSAGLVAGALAVAAVALATIAPAYADDPVPGAHDRPVTRCSPTRATAATTCRTTTSTSTVDVTVSSTNNAAATTTFPATTTTITAATTGAPLSSYSPRLPGVGDHAGRRNPERRHGHGQRRAGHLLPHREHHDSSAVTDNHKLIVTPATPVDGAVHDRRRPTTAHPCGHADTDGSSEGWNNTTDGATFLNQPVGSMTVFPNNNTPRDKATYTFTIDVPSVLGTSNASVGGNLHASAVASNGELRVEDAQRRRLAHHVGVEPDRADGSASCR